MGKRWLAALLFVCLAPPLHAGWLVLRDGTPIETLGGWKIADNRVSYSQPDGKEVSVMIVVIDPDATRLANIPGSPPPVAPANPAADPARKKFVINDETLKQNRGVNPREEQRKQSLAAVTEVLKIIVDCATRYPHDRRAYLRCYQDSLPH